jgi:hypothetical protein
MKRTCRFELSIIILLLASHASAASDVGQKVGLGANLCAQFSKDYGADPSSAEKAYWSWATGMMSGMNLASAVNSNTFRDLTGDDDIFRRAVRNYCQSHPLTSYSSAVLDLYVSLPLKKTASR